MRPARSSLVCALLLLSAAPGPLAQFGQTLLRLHSGGQFDEQLGTSCTAVDDLDLDGVDDYVVGAPGHATSQGEVGRILAISGRTGAVLYARTGTLDGERFGHSIARIGDPDRDGVDDFVVGSPYRRNAGRTPGRVSCFSGRSGALIWSVFGSNDDGLFGWSVAGGRLPGSAEGYVVVGGPGTSGTDGSVWLVGEQRGSLFHRVFTADARDLGWSVAMRGRLVVVGQPGSGGSSQGSVRLFEIGSTAFLRELTPRLEFANGARYGSTVLANDDPRGGSWDFAVAAVGSGSSPGRVELLRVSGESLGLIATLFGTRAGDGFGQSIAVGADADGDGVRDLVVGAPQHSLFGARSGALHFYSGANLQRTYTVLGGAGEGFAWDVAFVGDTDGDGLADVLVGAPFRDASAVTDSGEARVYGVDVQGSAVAFGTSCTGGGILANGSRLLGGGFARVTATGFAAQAPAFCLLGLDEVAVDLGAIGMPGCFAHTTVLDAPPIVVDGAGVAVLDVPLPAAAGLVRQSFRAQVVALDSQANAAGAVTSRALRFTLGNR